MQNLYLSRAVLNCFEGEGAADAGAGGVIVPDASGRFTQEQLNEVLARDRRKHQAKLEKMVEDVQTCANLTAAERESLAQQLDEMRAQTQTKEERLAAERKSLEADFEKRLKAETKAREKWESQYKSETTERALLDAAVSGDAYDTDTMMAVLRPMTQLREVADDKGKPTGKFRSVVEFKDVGEDGQPVTVEHTPQSAVKRMKELPKYVNLFKSGVISGVGASSATGGLTPGSNGRIDVKNLTQEQYMKIREERPELLGLRPLKKGQHRS